MKKQSQLVGQAVGQALHEFFKSNGAKGGHSRSQKKRQTAAANLAKARSKRWKKKRKV